MFRAKSQTSPFVLFACCEVDCGCAVCISHIALRLLRHHSSFRIFCFCYDYCLIIPLAQSEANAHSYNCFHSMQQLFSFEFHNVSYGDSIRLLMHSFVIISLRVLRAACSMLLRFLVHSVALFRIETVHSTFLSLFFFFFVFFFCFESRAGI